MKRTGRWVAVGSVCLLAVTGCTDQPASSAATIGDSQVELQELSDQLLAINEVLGLPADAVDVASTNTVLRNNVVYELVDQAAVSAGVDVSDAAVDQRLEDQIEFVGSEELLARQAAQAGVAPELIPTDIRVSLQAEALVLELAEGIELGPDEGQLVLIAEIQRFSEDVGTVVNPRFGIWDANSLSIVADPDAPSAPAQLDFIGFP
jgi:hypothetical protein